MNEQTAKSGQAKLRRLMKGCAWGASAALALWVAWVVYCGVYGGSTLDRFAAFGDAMAFVGSAATAVALAIGAYSLLLQREDIDQQIAEMKGSREAQQQLATAQEDDTRLRRYEQLLRMCDVLDLDIQREYDLAWTNLRHTEALCQTNGPGLSLTAIRSSQLYWNALALGLDKAVIGARNGLTKVRIATLRKLSAEPTNEAIVQLVGLLEEVRLLWIQGLERVRDQAHAAGLTADG